MQIGVRSDGAFDLDGLQTALDEGIRALVLANPHNPTGRVLPAAELAAIAASLSPPRPRRSTSPA